MAHAEFSADVACVTDVEASEEYAEMTAYATEALAAHNCGTTPDGRLIVLAGCEHWNHTA